MKTVSALLATLAALLVLLGLALAPAAAGDLPRRDLTVQLRQVGEDAQTGEAYSVRAGAATPALVEQQIQVRNGEQASVSLGRSIPMQWVQSVSAQSASLAASGAQASSQSGAVANGLTWMDAGQSLKVLPRWPGGHQPVSVAIELQSASVGERYSDQLPTQTHSQLRTSVSAPLGQWVTLAATGRPAQPGVYGSDASANGRELLQIRVLAP